MYKECHTEESKLRQRSIEDGLLSMLKTHHYDQISVKDVCACVNIPRNTFYRYFEGKSDVLNALIDHAFLDYELNSINDGNLYSELENFFIYWKEKSELLDALEKSDLSIVLVNRCVFLGQNRINWKRFNIYNSKDNWQCNYTTQFIYGGVLTIIIRWHHEGFKQSPSELAKFCKKMIERRDVIELRNSSIVLKST